MFRYEVLYSLSLLLGEFSQFPVTLAVKLALELVDLARDALFFASRATEAFAMVNLGVVLNGFTWVHRLCTHLARYSTATETEAISGRLGFLLCPLHLGLFSCESVLFPALLAVKFIFENGRLIHGQFFHARTAFEAISVVDFVLEFCDFSGIARLLADNTRNTTASKILNVYGVRSIRRRC